MARVLLLACAMVALGALAFATAPAESSHTFDATISPTIVRSIPASSDFRLTVATTTSATGAEQLVVVAPAGLAANASAASTAPPGYAASTGRFTSGPYSGRWYVEYVGFRQQATTAFPVPFLAPAAIPDGVHGFVLQHARVTVGGSDLQTATRNLIVDSAPPTISFQSALPAPNGAGWNTADVTVTWACTDPLSGAAQPTVSQIVTGSGDALSATGTCLDNAGNSAQHTRTGVKIDRTAPGISRLSRLPAANAAGWNSGDVTVTWTCTDALSGPLAATNATTVTTSGQGLTATGTCRDVAGNSASLTESAIHIDRTSPTIVRSSRLPAANAAGWNTGNVTVTWTCADALSGVVASTTAATATGEGAALSVGGTCTDNAGNSASLTESDIRIDRASPTIALLSRTAANAAGWNSGDVVVQWSCSDPLSGAAAPTVSSTVAGEGSALNATGTCADLAGNTASLVESGIQIDRTAPGIAYASQSPLANGAGWNLADVTLTWTCSDALSGPAASTVSETVTGAGSNLGATGTCADLAGNTAQNARSGVKIDRTAPTIAFFSRTPANADGWNSGDVIVQWTCADALSGPVATPVSTTVTSEGDSLSASGTCTDAAGNTAGSSESGIKIDRTAPTATLASRTPANAAGWNVGPVTAVWDCADALSGVVAASSTATVSTSASNQTATGSCADRAGNVATPSHGGISIDTVEPSTDGVFGGTAGEGDWFVSGVTVTLSGSDALSGVARTETSVDGGATWTAYTSPFTLTTPGTTNLLWRSVDVAGNEEPTRTTTLRIDTSAPTTTSSLAGTAGSGGWFRGPVTVTLAATDVGSGVTTTVYSLNGGITWTSYTAPFTVSTTGTRTLHFGSRDAAGNFALATPVTIQIDALAPSSAVVVTPAAGASGWHTKPPRFTLAASDATSGVKEIRYSIDGTTYRPYTAPFDVVAEGAVTIRWYAVDAAGNQEATRSRDLRIDLTAPTTNAVATTTPAGTGWYTSPLRVTLEPADAVSGVASTIYSVDGGETWHPYSGAIEFAESGRFVLLFASADAAGNEETPSAALIGLDLTPPVATAVVGGEAGSNGWILGAASIALEAEDATSGVATALWSLDNVTWNVYEGPIAVETSGVTPFYFVAVDVAGNHGEVRRIDVRVDREVPTLSLTADGPMGNSGWFVGPARIVLAASDAGSGVARLEFRLDDGAWQLYGDPFAISSEGRTGVAARVTDHAGRVVESKALDVYVDAQLPGVKLALVPEPEANGWYRATPVATLEGSDSGAGIAGIAFRVGLGAWRIYEGPFTLPDGDSVVIEVEATDAAGRSRVSTFGPFAIDTEPPAAASLDAIPEFESGATVTITWTSSSPDLAYAIERRLPGGDFELLATGLPAEGTYPDGSLTEGVLHEYRLRTTDAAGHSVVSNVVATTPDRTAPTAPPPRALRGLASFDSFAAPITDAASGVASARYRFLRDGIVVSEATFTPPNLAGPFDLSSGSYVLEVRAIDRAGNLRDWTPVGSFTLALNPPVVRLTSPTPGASVPATVRVDGTVIDRLGASRLTLRVDGGSPIEVPVEAGGIFSISLTLRPGPHNLTLLAVDEVGRQTVVGPVAVTVAEEAVTVGSPGGGSIPGPATLGLLVLVSVAALAARRRRGGRFRGLGVTFT